MTPDSNIPRVNFENLFLEDPLADRIWSHWLGSAIYADLKSEFIAMGKRGALATGFSLTADSLGPKLKSYSPQGERIDHVEYHPAYRELEKLAYEGKIVSRKYNSDFLKKFSSVRHLSGFGIGYYFAQTEIGLYCPICMTDGLGRVLEKHGKGKIIEQTLSRISSESLESLWQGAMFLTEKQGGSDVGLNAAQAERVGDQWLITGDKWFCSNVDAEAILVLARMPQNEGGYLAGTRGLGLFLVLREIPETNFKSIRIHRLKEKLGVRSMASGEVSLEKTVGYLIGGADQGFKQMAEMLNMSRLYNSVASIAGMRRAVLEALAYGKERKAFGVPLRELPLWRSSMADLIAEQIGSMHLVFPATKYLDQADSGDLMSALMIRILTPIAKATTGKLAIFAASEAMEAIGGNAYIEEHIMPRVLRDCQVLPIWEGTTNILSLDALRVFTKHGPEFFYQEMRNLLANVKSSASESEFSEISDRLKRDEEFLGMLLNSSNAEQQRAIRHWVEMAARSFTLLKVLESAAVPKLRDEMKAVFRRLVLRPFSSSPLGAIYDPSLEATEELLLRAGYR